MAKIEKYFETPKKAAVTVTCVIIALLVLGTGSVFAAGAIAESNAIGAENAKNFAFADAGVDPASVQYCEAEFDFEKGHFVYDIAFSAGGSKYEYLIKSSDGSVVKREVEITARDGSDVVVTAKITADEAKETALADAGLAASDVTFTKQNLDIDDGMTVYEIDFVAGSVEFEYEINADTGDIYSKSKESIPTVPPAGASDFPVDSSDPSAASSAASGVAGTGTDPAPPQNNGTIHQDNAFGTHDTHDTHDIHHVQSASNGSGAQNMSGSGAPAYIGDDKAKSIAAGHAGFSVGDIAFIKAELDEDDGRMVYEVEFDRGSTEYEYTIDALTGDILDYDIDID